MFESLLFILLGVLGCVILTWYIMNRRVKNINEQLSDKQVVIKELANYAEKISNDQEGFTIKKTIKKPSKKETTKKQKKVVEKKPKTTKKPKNNGEIK